MSACAASYSSCRLRWLFGEPASGELLLGAGVDCTNSVAHIEVEACLWSYIDNGESTGNLQNYRQFECGTQTASNKKGEVVLVSGQCSEGQTYRAWVWGRASGANYWFATGGVVSKSWECADAGYGVAREYLEYVLEK